MGGRTLHWEVHYISTILIFFIQNNNQYLNIFYEIQWWGNSTKLQNQFCPGQLMDVGY